MQRLIFHNRVQSDDWEQDTIRKSSEEFYLSDEEFQTLQELPREYNYEEFDNEFCIDRHPSLLYECIDNTAFVQDYEAHLNDKFFVAYTYRKEESDAD